MTPWLWIFFGSLVAALVLLDLLVLTRRPRAVTPGEARASLALWVLGAAAFSFLVFHAYQSNFLRLEELLSVPLDRQPLDGQTAWTQLATCYALELALSLDNIAVLALLFRYFRVPAHLLPRALFWSVLIALFTRWLMIQGAADVLYHHPAFKWALGAILLLAAVRIVVLPDQSKNFERAWYVRLVRRVVPVTSSFQGQRLLARDASGRLALTPLALAVVVGALLDLVSALETVPALFSVTKDPMLAFSASALAMLALRSAYFAVSGVIGRFRFLKLSLVAVLAYIAVTLFLLDVTAISPLLTVIVVGAVMGLGVGMSVYSARRGAVAPRPQAVSALVDEPEIPTPLEDFTTAVDIARRNLRKIWVLIAGTSVIIFGIIISPLPGPGFTVMLPLGLAILASEFVWAKRLLNKAKEGAFSLSDRLDALTDARGLWVIPAVFAVFWVLALSAIYGGCWLINFKASLLGFEGVNLRPRWWHIAVVAGSPFFPLLAWGVNYLRKRFWLKQYPVAPLKPPSSPPPGAGDAPR
jgi:tellurite resistance protein TerC